MPVKNPFVGKPANPLWEYVTPVNTGLAVGATLAALPNGWSVGGKYVDGILDMLLKSEVIPKRYCVAGLGFITAYLAAKSFTWMRWKLVKSLLTYTGWMTAPKSLRTKAWALLLKALYGPGPLSTFALQPYIPNLPLPKLDDTLDRWLTVAKELVNQDEFEITKERVEQFRQNEGPKLQQFLQEKAKATGSWIHSYWLNAVYLASRVMLPVNSNYYGMHTILKNTMDPIVRAATITRIFAEFHMIVEKEKLQPVFLQGIVPLCMDGYKYFFNSVRIPKQYQDVIERHPGNKHIIVIRRGHYFKIDVYYDDGTLLTAEEIKKLLTEVKAVAEDLPQALPVASLTTQQRDTWAKQRVQLMERNKELMKDIDSSMFVLSLSEQKPKNASETALMALTGNQNEIWFDKGMTYVVYDNGVSSAGNIDHTAIDAMVFVTPSEYIIANEKYENGDVVKDPNQPPRNLKSPTRLTWDMTGMEEVITKASKDYVEKAEDVDMIAYIAKYGKGFMKKCRLSPDGYIQMALQLAYYKMHREIVRTYEPSTLRLFFLGRTETVNPISSMSVAWVKAMCDGTSSAEDMKDMLKKAVNYQTKYRLEATIGKGCDRHLLALMCASRELGMDLPNIFMDKPWQMPYKLSTSQTPSRMFEFSRDYDFEATCGGFGPACPDGYGVSYTMHGDDILNFHITSYKSCPSTSTERFCQSLEEAMEDMKALFTT